jgi:hypothetical protein
MRARLTSEHRGMTVTGHNRAGALIQARHLSKRYGSARAVDDLSFTVEPGRRDV